MKSYFLKTKRIQILYCKNTAPAEHSVWRGVSQFSVLRMSSGAGVALCGVFGRHIELFHFKGGFGQRVFIFAVFYAQPHCEKGGNIVIR